MSVILALAAYLYLAVILHPLWLFLPVAIFGGMWLLNSRERVLAAVDAAPADPELHAQILDHVRRSAVAMGVALPDVYVSPSPVRNAFAGTDHDGGYVCVLQGTLDVLEDDELGAVLAHEVGHLKNRDTQFLMFFQSVRISLAVVVTIFAAFVAVIGAFFFRGRSVSIAAGLGAAVAGLGAIVAFVLITAGQRSREYGADRLAAETEPDPLALGRALTRLEQAEERWHYGEVPIVVASRCIVPPYTSSFLSSIVASHPSLERRIARIESRLTPERKAGLDRRAKELQDQAAIEQWKAVDTSKRDFLEFARSAQPQALGRHGPFLTEPGEAMWLSCPARLLRTTTVDGTPGFKIAETGEVVLTTHRAAFVGTTGRVEWRWNRLYDSKWIDGVDGGDALVLAVGDRKRNSGIWVDRSFAPQLRTVFDVALAEHNGVRSALVGRLEADLLVHERERPLTV